jgi:hypothetical protein
MDEIVKKFPELSDMKEIPLQKEDYTTGIVEFPIKIIDIYGKGAYNVVLKISDKKRRIYALRIGYLFENLKRYIDLQKLLSKYDMTTTLYHQGKITKDIHYFIFSNISIVLKDYLIEYTFNPENIWRALKCLLTKKYVLNMLHGDMHIENIALLKDRVTMGFIDFDYTILPIKQQYTILDFIPLLGSLLAIRNRDVDILIGYILEYYKETFNMDIDLKYIKKEKIGGYSYKNLFSYIKAREFKTTTADIYSVFPQLTLPRIVR